VNIWLRHPKENTRPLIYYDLIVVFYPMELGGANIGIVLATMFPSTILLIMAVAVLLYAMVISLKRGLTLFDAENIALGRAGALEVAPGTAPETIDGPPVPEESTALLATPPRLHRRSNRTPALDMDKVNFSSLKNESADDHDFYVATVANMLAEETAVKLESLDDLEGETDASSTARSNEHDPMKIPWKIIGVSLAIWMLCAASYFALDNTVACSDSYYFLLVIIYPFILGQVYWSYWNLVSKQRKCLPDSVRLGHEHGSDDNLSEIMEASEAGDIKGDCESEITRSRSTSIASTEFSISTRVLEGDLIWEQVSILPFLLCTLIGCLSAMIGVGGGELFSPMLLSMNIKPEVVAATLPCMLILNTSSSLLKYLVLGEVEYTAALWMFCIGCLGGFVGRSMSVYLTDIFKRTSIIVFLFVFVLLSSLGIYLYYLYEDVGSMDFTFSNFCNLF
jgi:uncharacterized membrane protein YfcA